MQKKLIIFMLFLFGPDIVLGAPVVQKINNQSEIGFMIVHHSDKSPCSLHDTRTLVDAKSTFLNEFLIAASSKKITMPKLDWLPSQNYSLNISFMLRPAYYLDLTAGKKFWFLDDNNMIDEAKLHVAFKAWSKNNKRRKNFANAQAWMKNWVGGDIVVIPDVIELFGYLINLSRIYIGNQITNHGQWLSYAQGIFSRLVLDIAIEQHKRKGISPHFVAVAGQGGICMDGAIVRI